MSNKATESQMIKEGIFMFCFMFFNHVMELQNSRYNVLDFNLIVL